MNRLVGRSPGMSLAVLGWLVIASCGRPLGAWFDRNGNENAPTDAGGPGPWDARVPPVDPNLRDPCKNMGGYDPEAPWPTWRGCPSRAALGKHAGPGEATIAWDVPCPFGLEGVAVDSEGRIIGCGASTGSLAARSPEDGSILWQAARPDGAPLQGFPSLRADGLIIVPSQPGLAAFSAQGEPMWSTAMELHGTRGSVLLPDHDRIFCSVPEVMNDSLALYRFGGDGQVERIFRTDELGGYLAQTQFAMLSNGDPVLATSLPAVHLFSVGRLSHDDQVRTVLWHDPGSPGAASVGWDDTIYLSGGTSNPIGTSEIIGVSTDGDITVRISDFGSADQPPAIALDGDLLAVTTVDSGTPPNLRRHSPDGRLRFSVDLLDFSNGAVVVDALGTAYVGSDHSVLAVDSDGQLLWTLTLPGQFPHSLALGPPGRLYVQTLERLYAIGSASP